MLQIAQCSGSRFFAVTSTGLRTATQKIQVPALGYTIGPYAYFVKENFAKEKHANKNGSTSDVLKNISAMWKKLPEDQKQVYVQKSTTYREEKIRDFQLLSSEEQKKEVEKAAELKQARAQRKERKEKRELREKTGHPDRPLTAFMLYVKDRFASLKSQEKTVTPVTTFLKKFSDEWKTVSEKEKEKYESESRAQREQYKEAVKNWKKTVSL